MAQTPVFKFKDIAFEAPLTKLNRDKVYGWVETKYADSDNNECNFITLLDDGKTMIDSGGLALKTINDIGDEIDKSTLIATNIADGTPALLQPSVFEQENVLSTDKTLEDYLLMDVKSVYQLGISGDDQILALLKEHKVLYLPFNYRAGYDPDDAFLISQGEHIFIVVGKFNQFTFSSLELPTVLEDESDEEAVDLDSNMF